MDIHILALAFMAVIYTVIVLVSGNLIAYLLGKYWPQIKVAQFIAVCRRSK
jgi:uncharacterized membrane protein YdjX (TVP38/TMEM64 family)